MKYSNLYFFVANLCLQSFAIAARFLRKGGWFVSKVFRSRDYEPLKWVFSQFFRSVRSIKPEASRLESAEIFLVGQFYLAPSNIDPKFFDSRYVFGEIDIPKDRSSVISDFFRDRNKKKLVFKLNFMLGRLKVTVMVTIYIRKLRFRRFLIRVIH